MSKIIENVSEYISEYIDLKILGIFLVALASFVVLKIIFRRISLPKIIAVILVLSVIIGNGCLVYFYIVDEENRYISTTNQYFIQAKVDFISNAVKKIRVTYVDTNVLIMDLEKEELIIKIISSTGIYNKEGKKIHLNDIKAGDMIIVKTTQGVLRDGKDEIVARTIQKY